MKKKKKKPAGKEKGGKRSNEVWFENETFFTEFYIEILNLSRRWRM